MKTRVESELTELTKEQREDAVDVLTGLVERNCEIAIGREFQTPKTDLELAFALLCKDAQIEPLGNGLLGTFLVKLYPAVWSDSIELNGEKTPVWRNLVLKEMPVPKNQGAE